MGVLDFLKKNTQNSNTQQATTGYQTQTDDDKDDVQASYGSFFGNSSVSYPLPTAGAPLTPNYGGPAVQTAPTQDPVTPVFGSDPNQFQTTNAPTTFQPAAAQTAVLDGGMKLTTSENTMKQGDTLDLEDKELDFNAELSNVTFNTTANSVPPTTTPLTTAPENLLANPQPAQNIDLNAQSASDSENSAPKYDDFNPPMDTLVFNSNPQSLESRPATQEQDLSSFYPSSSVAETVANLNKAEPKIEQPKPAVQPEIDWSALESTIPAAQPTAAQPVAPIAPVEEVKPIEVKPIVVETPKIETKVDAPTLKPENIDLSWLDDMVAKSTAKEVAPKVEPVKTEALKPVIAEAPKAVKAESVKTNETKKIESAPAQAIELKYFKDIALIGLNSGLESESYKTLLRQLVGSLKANTTRIFLDSSRRYRNVVMEELQDASNLEINGAYLRPYFSAYSDEPNGEIPDLKNYTETLFSNIVERLRYLYTSAELFIVVESQGLVNLTDIVFLLAMQKMYYGKHKPVILFGPAWKEKLPSLEALLNDDEKDKLYIAVTVEELQSIVKKVEEGYNKNNFYATKRVTDLRDIEDEKQFMM